MIYPKVHDRNSGMIDQATALRGIVIGFNMNLSELDKITMNLLFKPAPPTDEELEEFPGIPMYTPQKGSSGFYHCGREVLNTSLCGGRIDGDARCSSNNNGISISCPSCRVYKTKAADDLIEAGKWIGFSGLIYCGSSSCNVNEGLNCQACHQMQKTEDE